MITSRQIISQAFDLQKPERVPVGVSLGGSWPFYIEGFSTREILSCSPREAAEIYYRVNQRVGADLITVGTGATAFLFESLGGEVKFSGTGSPQIEPLDVKTVEDIIELEAKLDNLFNTKNFKWLKNIAEETVKINSNNDNPKAIFISGRAAFTLAGQITGLEKLSKALYKDKPFVEKLLAFATELSVRFFEFMLDFSDSESIDGIFIAEPSASGDVVSPKHFESVILPTITEILARLKPHMKLSLIHICGDITDRLHLLPKTGVQMVSVDSKVNLKKAKEILNGQIALAGNVNPVFSIEEKTADGVYADSLQCLDDGAENGGFMLLPGCDLSSKATEENVRAFTKSVYEWGK